MRDALDKLIVDLARLDGAAEVGALDSETARKLSYAEFGTRKGVPPRPVLTTTTDRLEKAMNRAIDRRVGEVLDGRGRGLTGEELVGDVGRDLAEEVRNEIDGDTGDELAASTKRSRRRRGKDTRTLVDSGDMMRGIKVRTSADPDGFSDD